MRTIEQILGGFSLTTIAIVLGAVVVIEAIGRWYRATAWQRRARRDDEEED